MGVVGYIFGRKLKDWKENLRIGKKNCMGKYEKYRMALSESDKYGRHVCSEAKCRQMYQDNDIGARRFEEGVCFSAANKVT
jgi:hypothetical protein